MLTRVVAFDAGDIVFDLKLMMVLPLEQFADMYHIVESGEKAMEDLLVLTL